MSINSFSLLELGCGAIDATKDDAKQNPLNRCYLCENIRKVFYCKSCVKNGDFIHSTSRFSERFAEKRLRLLQLQNEKTRLSTEFDKRLVRPRQIEKKREASRVLNENIQILRALVQESHSKIKFKKIVLSEIHDFNMAAEKSLKKNTGFNNVVQRSLENVTNNKWPKTIDKLNIIRPIICKLLNKQIQQLIQYIFPILKLPYSSGADDVKKPDPHHGNEHWMLVDSWTEFYYLIVSSTLPDTGNYASYAHYFNSDALTTLSNCSVDHNPAYNISAAFTYTAQLTSIVAYYLDIRLPNKLPYSDFCGKQLNERKFVKFVTLLNANILYLCLSQNIDPNLLHPTQTINNILLLVTSTFDDQQLFVKNWVVEKSKFIGIFEDQLTNLYKNLNSKLNVDDENDEQIDLDSNANNDYDSDHLGVEWETVPLMALPLDTLPSNSPTDSYVNTINQSSSNITSALMTSAAAGFASFWRGFTTHK